MCVSVRKWDGMRERESEKERETECKEERGGDWVREREREIMCNTERDRELVRKREKVLCQNIYSYACMTFTELQENDGM